MNVFAKSDEILSMIYQDIKKRKRNGHTDGQKELKREITPIVLAPSPHFLLVVFALYI